ncbi:MAG: hypothetical protein ACTSUR_01660 [Candidatus Heimdallarchaeaceae archaeon]
MTFEEEREKTEMKEEEKVEEKETLEEIQAQIKEQHKEEEEREKKLEEELQIKEEEREKEEVEEEEKMAKKESIQEKEEKEKKKKKISYATFKVDLWRTKLHIQEWGIRLDAQRAQKDRQWTRDMDMLGIVEKDGETYGGLAIREGIWKIKDHLEKRFVMKLFTKSGYWRASIERLQGESFANSHATKEPCPVYACIFKHTRNIFRIKRLAHFPRFQGEVFGFSYLDEDDVFKSFVIDDRRLTFGSDWMIKDIHNKIVAEINGKFANLGGKFLINIYDPLLAENKTFYTMLVLFSSTLRFYPEIKKNIRKSLKILRRTKQDIKLDDSETNLYLNPRKLSV